MQVLKYKEFYNYQKFLNESENHQNDPNDFLLKEAKLDVSRSVSFLIARYPFFGEYLINCRFLYDAPGVNTMATDGHNIFINSKFVAAMSDDEIKFVLCHEILHIMLFHFSRFDKYVGSNAGRAERETWNVAADHEINPMLVDEGLITADHLKRGVGGVIPCYDEKWKVDEKWMAAEPIYDRLGTASQKEPDNYPTNIGDIIQTSDGKWGQITKINIDGTIDATELTHDEAIKILEK